MRRKLLVLVMAAIPLLVGVVWTEARAAAQRDTIVGEVIDVAGYAMRDARGPEEADAGQYHADNGFPVGILEEDGTVWIAVYRNPAPASGLETANQLLSPLMGKEVVVQGKKYSKAGVNLIEIAIVGEV